MPPQNTHEIFRKEIDFDRLCKEIPNWHNDYPLDQFQGKLKEDILYLIQYRNERAIEDYKEKQALQDNPRH